MTSNDQIYINTVKEQIKSGTYEHLLCRHPLEWPDCILGRGSNMVFLDIGANIGEVSRYFSPYCKRIVAVEPAPETFVTLATSVDDMNIECYQLALAPIDAPVDFYVNDINFTASSTVNTYGKKITVEGIRLSTLLRQFNLDHVDVCKIDAEGAEGESLNMVELERAKDIIKTYYIETHNCPKTTWEHKLGTLVGNLARVGYSKMQIDGMAITATRP